MNHSVTRTSFVSQSVFWKSILIIAALLLGMGVVFAVAANWQNLSRADKFTILQSTIVASAALTLLVRSAKVAGALLLILCIGAIWAFFGQTFQTGVDSWQLFALWSALALAIALAVRHDAVWSLWLVITLIALRLWQYSYEGHSFFGCSPGAGNSNVYQLITTLVPWAVAAGLCAYLSRYVLMNGAQPSLAIARKIALVGGLSFVVPKLMEIGFGMLSTGPNFGCGGTMDVLFVVLGLGLLLGLAWFSQKSFGRNDIGYVLALFSLWLFAMSILARPLFDNGLGGILTFSMIGMASLAWMGWFLLSIRSTHASTNAPTNAPTSAPAQNKSSVAGRSDARLSITLQIVMMLGAFICTALFVVAFVLLFNATNSVALMALAVVLGIAAIVVNRQPEHSFVYQFTVPLILTSMGFVVASASASSINLHIIFGLILALSMLFLALCQGTLVLRLLGMLCAVDLMAWISWGSALHFNVAPLVLWYSALAMTLLWGLARFLVPKYKGTLAHLQDKLYLFLEGFISAVLIQWLSLSGDSFLLSALAPMGPSDVLGGSMQRVSKAQWLVSAACVLAAGLVFWHTIKSQLKSTDHAATKPFKWLAYLTVLATVLALTQLSVTFGVLVLIAAALMHFNQRYLLYFTLLCLLWALGSVYYSTHLSLLHKSIWMIAIALGFLLAYVLARWQNLFQFADGQDDAHNRAALSQSHTSTRILWVGVLGSVVLCLGLLNWNIHAKETVIAQGRAIYIPLAPVDPRSIMAGDYMSLGWDVPEAVDSWRTQVLPWVDPRPAVVLALDSKGVVQVPGVLATAPSTPNANEIKIKLSFVDGRWVYVTNGYYFAEGAAAKFERAKFGEFRVMPDGTALLVGLCDEHLTRIQE